MATAFMGYVLPFGQMSFWGATVITNLLSPFPSLIEWVSGGHYVYNPTLKRFFIFHFLFPFLLCGFRILHLFYLHFLSSNNPLVLEGFRKVEQLLTVETRTRVKDILQVLISLHSCYLFHFL